MFFHSLHNPLQSYLYHPQQCSFNSSTQDEGPEAIQFGSSGGYGDSGCRSTSLLLLFAWVVANVEDYI